ncbi:MAG: carbonic anhydrase [Chloroflexi bacterium]|nr:carbonic anhydrase [Chloroflexota bacterium]|tara:strand:- start:20136 stop:20732 length:597 start_codon:yes stop_codon:yes gene_type:complete
MTPDNALQKLLDGNKRFASQITQNRNIAEEIASTVDGVDGYAAVISCMDARVNAEQIFDTKIGDIFVLRVGGGVINQDIVDSIEIAINMTQVKLVIMLGHTKCGAIVNATKNKDKEVSQLIAKVLPALDAVPASLGEPSLSNIPYLRKAEEMQVVLSAQQLEESSPLISNLINENQLMIANAMYDVETGKVTILEASS